MTDPSNPRRNRHWWPALLAGVTAVVVAAMGGVTNIATSSLPSTWTWTHDLLIVWGLVGLLLVLTVVLAVVSSRSDSGRGPESTGHRIGGNFIGSVGAGAIVVTGSGSVSLTPGVSAADAGAKSPGQASRTAGQVLIGGIPAQPPSFLQRQAGADLAAGWDASAHGCVVQVLAGGPGVGKSQAAATYARLRAAEGWPIVAWITAETQDQLRIGLASLAIAIGAADAEGDSASSARNVRRYLETSPGPALIVLDNATDVDGLSTFIPTVGSVHVVITSTDRSFSRLGASVEIGLFTPEQSVIYLKNRTGLTDEAASSAVAAELGYLPLALAQAATVINEQSLDYTTYLHRLHDGPAAKYLIRLAGDPYPLGVVDAIALAILNVEAQDNSGLTRLVIRLMSVLSAEGVDRSLFTGLAAVAGTVTSDCLPLHGDEAVDQVLGRLVGASILTRSDTGRAFMMHRLVSRVIRERDRSSGELLPALDIATNLLHHFKIPEEERWKRRDEGIRLVEQIKAVWTSFSSSINSDDPAFRDISGKLLSLRNWSISQLIDASDVHQAILLAAAVLPDCQRLLGPDHNETLISIGNFAEACISAGRVHEAITLFDRNVTNYERICGANHSDTLTARENLAEAYGEAGRLHEAITLHENNLTARENLLGADHPDTLITRHNLAEAYESVGRLREAIPLLEKSATDNERVHGSNHPTTFAARICLARAYKSVGRLNEAIISLERNLSESERLFGQYHTGTLMARNNLALAYQSAGRLREAVALLERNLNDSDQALGPHHPSTLVAYNNLASIYGDTGRMHKAITLHELNVANCEKLLSPDHPDILMMRNNLGWAYRSAGRLLKAIQLFGKNFSDCEKSLGRDHPYTLISRHSLAVAYMGVGRILKAIILYRQNATETKRVLEAGHPLRRLYRQAYWRNLLWIPVFSILILLNLQSLKDVFVAASLCIVLVVEAYIMLLVVRLFLASGDWAFLNSAWYQQLLYLRTKVKHLRFRHH